MNSQETLATLGTQDTDEDTQNIKTQHRKLKKMSNTDTTKKMGVNPGACKG